MIGLLFWLFIFVIIYTYAGYPLLVSLLARLAPRRPPGQLPEQLPGVTLLIAAYNEEPVIGAKIENSLTLDYPRERIQILIASDGSVDRTGEIVRGYAAQGVELVHSPERRGKTAAINRAVPLARGDVIVFSDANNFYSPSALRELVAPLSDPSVGAVSGAKTIERGDGALGESEGLYWKYESFIKMQETRLGSCLGVAGEILAIRRELFEPLPERVINDDFYIAMRIIRRGYRVVYAPRARSTELASVSAGDEVARRSRIVAGRYQAITLAPKLLPFRRPVVIWEVLSHKFLRPLVPLAMAGAAITNVIALIQPPATGPALLRLAPPINWMLLLAQAAFYALAWLGNRTGHDGKLGKALYVPAFLLNSNLAAVIGLYRFATGRQTNLWQRARRLEPHSIKREEGL